MKILISGASGMIGSALMGELVRAGHDVQALVRDGAGKGSGVPWEVSSGRLHLQGFDPDVLIHLAGESLVNGKWTEEKMTAIRESRVNATRLLADWLSVQPNRPPVVFSASGVGIYGTRADRWVIETTPASTDFLGQLCFDWERATQPLERAGARVAHLRFGMVLSAEGGALAKMLPFFRWGLGGPAGGGSQWVSWITLDDVVRAILFMLDNENVSGPVNMVAPNPVTNAEFARTLAKAMKKPSFMRASPGLLHLFYGDMVDQTVLASQRVKPQALLEMGFEWVHPTLEGALRAMLQRG